MQPGERSAAGERTAGERSIEAFVSDEIENTIDVTVRFKRFGKPDKVLAELTRTLTRVIELNAGGGQILDVQTNSKRKEPQADDE